MLAEMARGRFFMGRPVEEVEKLDPFMHEDSREKHPAFGQVLVSKRYHGGGCRLYGTPLEFHPTTVYITVKRSERIHGLSQDRYHGHGLPLIEIELSAAQFTEMLMGMNEGDGVPCTIRATESDHMVPAIPNEDKNEVERIEEEFTKSMSELDDKVAKMKERAKEILDQPRLKKADKEELLLLIGRVQRFYWDHSPFVMKSFREGVQKGVNTAKRELDSFVSVMAQKTGIKALRDMTVPDQIRQLTGATADEDADNDSGD